MLRRSLLLSWKLIILASVLSACGGAGRAINNDTDNYKKVTLSLRHTQIKETNRIRLRILEDVLAKTESENDWITFKLEGIDEIVNRDTKLKQEMVVGNPPDIFEVFGGADLQLYVKAGRMLDLTDILQELDLVDKFESLEEFIIDGRIYGIPHGGYSEGIFYNKLIFNKLGLDIPRTWDELLDAAEKLKAAGYTPFGLAAKDAWVAGMIWNVIMERHVGIEAFYGLVTGETKWTDPAFIRGFQAYAELIEREAFTKEALSLTYADQGTQLAYGKAAMVYTGSWDAHYFATSHSHVTREGIGFFLFPSIPGGEGDQQSINASFSNGVGFSSQLSEDQIEAVKLFIANYFTEDIQKRALQEGKLLPSFKLEDMSGVTPLMNEILTEMSNASGNWPAYDAIVQPVVGAQIGISLQELIGGVSSPEKVARDIQEVQDRANAALNQFTLESGPSPNIE
ncbi:extracellular solute-binding protein [Paenibacillus chungangensis]|uniref:Extracellular solute-binding protein n=1 Tax=Paenibacillus chungangensis TaxID=696535 RepID=A0ABW3HLG1_9BACL